MKISSFSWTMLLVLFLGWTLNLTVNSPLAYANDKKTSSESSVSEVMEADVVSGSILTRAWRGGIIVFCVLLILIVLSILSWAIGSAKIFYLNRMDRTGSSFVKTFWDSRSLNDLNGRLGEYPYSPIKEVFRIGYAELVRGSQLRDQSGSQSQLVVNAAIDNLSRSLNKAKIFERKRLERYLSLLAISASASPFIGLFGTVWGIMGAFEGIARTGSASLAAVAPGISEALIATAFGLAAAIPAVVAYNIAGAKIRGLMIQIDGFSADFLNIVERYLVTDKAGRGQSGPTAGTTAPTTSESAL